MNAKKLALVVLGIFSGAALLLSACSVTPSAAATADPAEVEVRSPEQVVEGFYSWYLGYIGQTPGERRNPLVDGAYRSSPDLTPELVAQIDATLASFEGGGYDPFLCAQDVPQSVTVDAAVVAGESAHTVVHTSFEGHSFRVDLQRVDGQWKIAGIACGG